MTTDRQTPAVDVLGVRVGVLAPDRLVETVESWVDAGSREYVTFTGVHGVMESQRSADLVSIHNAAGIVAPDGMPLVWAGKWANVPGGARCYGPDLTLMLCTRAARLGWPVYFYGGKSGTPELLAQRLCDRIPGLVIAGTYSPPFRELTEGEILEEATMINESGAKLVFVGLSTPKQERWMSRSRGLLEANVLLGVGAAFDFHAGHAKQAPLWVQQSGFEWAYRLAHEPRRLASRYMRNNPAFVRKVLRRPPSATRLAQRV